MNSDLPGKKANWKQVEELYSEALSKPRAERQQFLESACRGDAELRREVESLLASLEKDGSLLEVPAMEVAAQMLVRSQASSMQEPSRSQYSISDAPSTGKTDGTSKAGTVPGLMRKIFHHAPWWMYLLAAVFALDCLLRAHCYILGPERSDFAAVRARSEKQVSAPSNSGTAAQIAGIRPGDMILRIDGVPLRKINPIVLGANREVGRRYTVEVERKGQRLQFIVQARRVNVLQSWDNTIHAIWHINGLLLLATALLVAFARPFDLLARAGALALGTLSVGLYVTNPPPGYAALWRNLPIGLGNLLWIPNICVYLIGPIVLTFFVLFPRRLFRARWPWVVIWLPGLCFVPAFVYSMFALVYLPPQVSGNIFRNEIVYYGARLLGIYGLASVAALAVNYFRLTDLNDRRRLRLLLMGGGAAVLPSALRMAIWRFAPLVAVFSGLWAKVPDILVTLIFALFPISFAYSILRYRLLDIRLIIRQGIQYAVTRGVLLSIVPILGIILAVDLFAHGDQPLVKILQARGWVYAVLGIVAVATHSQRRRWGQAIDRRFFREHYDARRLLHEVAEEAGRARSFGHAAPRVVDRIDAALHPEFGAIMQRISGDTDFRTLASSSSEKSPPPLSAASILITSLHNASGALEVSCGEPILIQHQLPVHEIEYLHRARIDLLVPIALSPGRPEQKEAFFAFGAKRSEEPYTREDRRLLETIAANLSLPFEQEALAARYSPGTFDECPHCGTCWDSGAGRCTLDGAALTPVPLSRTLAGRYRLERRRGHGGMGTVYEARDEALGRRVAIKVIREDFVYKAAAVQRFQSEARATAVFDHPNVVTVHDYGVEAGTRAFLVMELLDGATLRDELRSHGRLDAGRVIEVFQPVCSAADAAHRHQLIHRDLKPENIFLVWNADAGTETVKVLDFGVAKFLDASDAAAESDSSVVTESGVLVGTPGYMSPEQLLGERPAVSWDLWALAVTAYESLTGALPFPVADRANWRQSVLTGNFTPLSEHLKDPPASWREFFALTLATAQERRPHSATEFMQLLEQSLS